MLACQANSLIDNSVNQLSIGYSGQPYTQPFSPFPSTTVTPTTYSYYADGGVANYLALAENAAYQFGTGDFTVEAWVNSPATTNTFGKRIVNHYYYSAADLGWCLAMNRTDGTQNLSFGGFTSGVAGISLVYNGAVPANQWHHVAVSRKGSTASLFLDGTRVATQSNVTWNDTTAVGYGLGIGVQPDVPTGTTFDGAISNVRIVKGSAVYDPTQSSLTVPTSPLTAVSGTVLLTCQSSTFIDNSITNNSFTTYGTAGLTSSFTPFSANIATGIAYGKVLGGSSYYDGSGDQLQAPRVYLGTHPFTAEGWVYISADVTSGVHAFWGASNGGGGSPKILFYINSNVLYTDIDGTPTGGPSVSSVSTYIKRGTWNHIALCRTSTAGGNSEIYINGISRARGAISDRSSVTAVWQVGGTEGSVAQAGTYIASFRLSIGVRRYYNNFAPPTGLFTSDQYTALLLNFNDAGFYDSTGKAEFETVGTPKVVTTQTKNNSAAAYFPSTTSTGDYFVSGDYSSVPSYALGTGDFTVEAWFYLNTLTFDNTAVAPIITYGNGGANGPLGLATAWALNLRQGTPYSIQWYRNLDASTEYNTTFNFSSPLVINTWYHIAVTRSGTNLIAWLNGQQVGSTVTSSQDYGNVSGVHRVWVGIQTGGGAANQYYRFPGIIDDVRVTRGVARYALPGFTPSKFGNR
jgi:hypothetical protein